MKLQFVKITKRKGVEKKEVVYRWDHVTERMVPIVCQNFLDGFLYSMKENNRPVRYPAVMIMQGWSAQTWRYHDSDSGTRWQFENGKGQYIAHWDKRRK